MSEEQKVTAVADVRNDIYSLGVIFSEMGIGYTSIINRCKLPINKRYQNIAELEDAFSSKTIQKRRYIMLLAALVIVIMTGIWSHHALEQHQMNKVIENGKAFVDKRMNDTGISEFLDTLSSMKYFNPVFIERLNDGMTAIEDYTQQIKSDYTEDELTRIRETLISHQNVRQKAWVDKFNQMKEAYDREVMQGD